LGSGVIHLYEATSPPGPCSTPCDDDCEAHCHESHKPADRRLHNPVTCLPEPAWGAISLDQLHEWVESVVEANKYELPEPGCPNCGAEVELLVTRSLSFTPPYRNSATLMPCGCTY
jgi:hypothetical protein